MTIYRAQDLHAQLLQALEQDGALEIDLSEVSEIDSAGLQLIAAAQASAAARAAPLRLLAPSPAVRELFELLGLPPDGALSEAQAA
ncbi:STAS domain-containing protein [Xylophilus rhododendri]|uniref:STAS domain-containing protein n=2 Tax=Xylophilus rhododendri TaxID=2697032 RepID=A0A857JE07_9BURK|nr:STAS domain-containing protein [Xylophilus rhododendri]